MARTARKESETGYYHVIMRGNNKSYVFKNKREKILYIETIMKMQEEGLIELVAWSVMDNHVHIVLKAELENMSLALKRINIRFAVRYHQIQKTSGHVFQDRFISEPIESDEYLMLVVRYVHNNPVKAKIVQDASDYEWSSYGRYLENDLNSTMAFTYQVMGNSPKKFEAFHKLEDHREYLEIKEDRDAYREERFNRIMANHCNEYGVIDGKETRVNKETSNELVRDLGENSGYSLRVVAKKLEIPFSRVQKCCKDNFII